MKIRPIFIVNSIVATVFGLGFMFIPGFIFGLLGFSTEADGPLAMRFFGIMVLGVGVLTFSARNSPDNISRKAIVISLFTIYTLMPIFHFWTIFGLGKGNIMLWSVIVLHGIFAILYGISIFNKT